MLSEILVFVFKSVNRSQTDSKFLIWGAKFSFEKKLNLERGVSFNHGHEVRNNKIIRDNKLSNVTYQKTPPPTYNKQM